MRIKGITLRWAKNTLLVTAVILLIMCVISVASVVGYYRNYVTTLLSGYANENVTNFFAPYLDSNDDTFEQKAIEFIEDFNAKSKIEVQVISKSGKIWSSSGFTVDSKNVKTEDVNEAFEGKTGVSKWSGFNENGEHIMSVAMVFPTKTDTFRGGVRFITSLKAIDSQVVSFIFLILLVFLIAMALVTLSGMFFVQTIVAPVRQINNTAREFADGNYDARVKDLGNDDEITELADSVNQMLSQVAATDKMKNDFISTVSHELRTPLTAIKGWGEMLKELDGEDRELSRRGTEVIINESDRLSRLVEELLDFSRMQNGNFSLRLEKIDVLAELDEAIFVFKERSKRDGIELSYSVPDIPAPMTADPNRIKQVFVNILDNAFKYTERGGRVYVEAFCSDGTLRINFIDNGCGISKEDLPNVKKKFYKANIQVRGSGIGLAVVDEIIKLHNGVFEIESEEGVGTKVTVILPVEKVVIEEPQPIANVTEETAVIKDEQ